MATQLSGPIAVAAQALYTEDSNQQHNLGELVHSNDGRQFRYCSAGGTALVAGDLQQSKVENTSDADLAVAAAAIGDTTVVTTTTVTVDLNEYAQGFLVVSTAPGLGQVLKIRSHLAAAAAALTLQLDDFVDVALTTTSRITLVANAYKDLVIQPGAGTSTSNVVGSALFPLTSTSFGWLGVGGLQPVLADGGITVGQECIVSNAVDGAVEDVASTTQQTVGAAASTIATGDVGLLNMTIG